MSLLHHPLLNRGKERRKGRNPTKQRRVARKRAKLIMRSDGVRVLQASLQRKPDKTECVLISRSVWPAIERVIISTRGRSSAPPLRDSGDGSRPINRRDNRCTLRTREAHDFNGCAFRQAHKPSLLSLRQARDYRGAEGQTAQQHKHRKARFEKVLPSSPHP